MAPTRRRVLAGTATGIAALAGCSGGSGPSDMTLKGIDHNTDWEVDVSLAVTFNEVTREEIQPGDTTIVAEDYYKFVLVRMDVTNTGENTRELRAHQYVVAGAGFQRKNVTEFDEHYLAGLTARPGETVTGWIAFQVRMNTGEGLLTVLQDRLTEGIDVTFTRDTSLDVSFPD